MQQDLRWIKEPKSLQPVPGKGEMSSTFGNQKISEVSEFTLETDLVYMLFNLLLLILLFSSPALARYMAQMCTKQK